MKHTRRTAVLSTAIALFATLVIGVSGCSIFGGSPAANVKDLPQATVGTLTINVDSDGSLILPRQQKLAFEMAGTVTAISVVKGDRVTKGQALAKLDDTALRNSVKQLELALIQRQNEVKLAQYDLDRAQEQIDETAPKTPIVFTYYTDIPLIQSSVASAQQAINDAVAAMAGGKTADANTLLAQALKSLDNAYQASGNSQFIDIGKTTPVSQSISQTQQLEYQRDRNQTALTLARGAVDAAALSLAQANKDLDKATLTAPFDGVVVDVPAKIGDRVAAPGVSATSIIQLADPSSIEAEALVDEVDIARVQAGQEGVIKADALPGAELRAKVTFISSVPNLKAGVVQYKVTMKLDPATPQFGQLKDGMTITAKIAVERRENVLLVPETAVKDARGAPWVQVAAADGTLEHRAVTLGKTDGKTREIAAGLKAGERVVA